MDQGLEGKELSAGGRGCAGGLCASKAGGHAVPEVEGSRGQLSRSGSRSGIDKKGRLSWGPRSPVSEGWGQRGDPGETASAGRDCRGEAGAQGGQLTMDSLDLGTQERSGRTVRWVDRNGGWGVSYPCWSTVAHVCMWPPRHLRAGKGLARRLVQGAPDPAIPVRGDCCWGQCLTVSSLSPQDGRPHCRPCRP